MHRISFAPELSATLRRVSCWITVSRRPLPFPPRNGAGRRGYAVQPQPRTGRRRRSPPLRPRAASQAPSPRLLRLLHDLKHAPALLLRDGARLGDADQVAHTALVLLVVDLEASPLPHGLAVEAVRLRGAHLDDDRLVHLVGDHRAQADLALTARGCGLVGAGPGLDGCVGHACSSVFLRRPRVGLAGASSTVSAGSSAAACGSSSPPTATADSSSGADATMPKSRSRSTVMIRAMSWRTFEIWLEFSSWPTACLKRSS